MLSLEGDTRSEEIKYAPLSERRIDLQHQFNRVQLSGGASNVGRTIAQRAYR